MSDIAKSAGKRIRNYRNQLGISQEKLAESGRNIPHSVVLKLDV